MEVWIVRMHHQEESVSLFSTSNQNLGPLSFSHSMPSDIFDNLWQHSYPYSDYSMYTILVLACRWRKRICVGLFHQLSLMYRITLVTN